MRVNDDPPLPCVLHICVCDVSIRRMKIKRRNVKTAKIITARGMRRVGGNYGKINVPGVYSKSGIFNKCQSKVELLLSGSRLIKK